MELDPSPDFFLVEQTPLQARVSSCRFAVHSSGMTPLGRRESVDSGFFQGTGFPCAFSAIFYLKAFCCITIHYKQRRHSCQLQGVKMNKNLPSICAFACGTAIFSCCCLTAQTPPLPPPNPNPISLQLPEVIYAVPGVEINIYFDNIVLVPNPDAYVFDVTCTKGRNDAKRWRFLPKPEDVGEFKWKVSVYDLQGLVAQAETKIVVAKPDAGKGRNLSVLIVGDSLTNAGVYPARVFELMSGDDNPAITMVGSNGPGYKPQPGGVAHEGWGGWAWKTFISKTKPHPKENTTPPNIPSRFLAIDDEGKGTIDLQNYFKLYNNGNPPDIVTFQLGVNDVFGANDDNLDARIADILAGRRPLHRFPPSCPNAIIGVGLVTRRCLQDAFGANYACGQTRWQYKKTNTA